MTSVTVIGWLGFRLERVFRDVALGELGPVRVPEDLPLQPRYAQSTQDYAAFQRTTAAHWNGYTSYAEDLEPERIEPGTREFG